MEFEEKLKLATKQGHDIGVCVRVELENKFLLIRRSAIDIGAGVFEMPGGSVDEDEDLRVGAVRELFEETDITTSPSELRPLGIFEFHNIETGKHKIKFAFSLSLAESPNIQLSEDHDAYNFFSRNEIEKLPREFKDKPCLLWEDHYRMLCL